MPDQPEPDNGVCTLEVAGEIDIAVVDGLLDNAGRCLATKPDTLVIDLVDVTFIDSSGLGALVRIRNDAGAQGTAVVLDRIPSSVARLFAVSGLDQVFEIKDGD